MIVKRTWTARKYGGLHRWVRSGWYLLGIIPLYIRDEQPRT